MKISASCWLAAECLLWSIGGCLFLQKTSSYKEIVKDESNRAEIKRDRCKVFIDWFDVCHFRRKQVLSTYLGSTFPCMVWKAMHGKFRQDFLVRMHSSGVIVPQLPTLELHIYFQLNKYAIHLWQTVCLSTVSDGGRFISPKDFEGFSRGIIIFTIDFHMAHYTYYTACHFSFVGDLSLFLLLFHSGRVRLRSTTTRSFTAACSAPSSYTRTSGIWLRLLTNRYQSHKKMKSLWELKKVAFGADTTVRAQELSVWGIGKIFR